MNILAYSAKRTLMDTIDTLLASDTVQVSYAAPGDLSALAVYGGAIRGIQSDAVAEAGVATNEDTTIDVIVRAYQPGNDARAADEAVESLADQIVGYLAEFPRLAGGLTVTGLASFAAEMPDFSASPEPTVTSTLVMQINVRGVF